MLVTITGVDGSGKSTISQAVARELSVLGYDAMLLDRWEVLNSTVHPSAAFILPTLHEFKKNVVDMSPPSRWYILLWTLAMAAHRHLDGGNKDRILIFDSYWSKHLAVETAYGLDAEDACNAARLLPRSDLTIFLEVSPQVALARKRGHLSPYECGMDPACGEESFLLHQAKVARGLATLAAQEEWTRMNADCAQPSIVRKILDLILLRFDGKQCAHG